MKIWLDDLRLAPNGWIHVYWPEEAIELMRANRVTQISLDHDLGDDNRGTGYDVILWIERSVTIDEIKPPIIFVHSADVSARKKMEAAMRKINQLTLQQEKYLHEHFEGYEKELLFHELQRDAHKDCPSLKVRTVTEIIRRVSPSFMDGLFEVQPCVRQLIYTGMLGLSGERTLSKNPFFVLGNTYTSIDFNGGTYAIEGYENGESRIGLAYFEVL